ncbi:UNVERIFIED_CONTAM: hypothetical protein GTU68_062983 [Idotea baltica]|nr:hypothetical protein [Idotea baltica]
MAPFALIYGLGVSLRNMLYSMGILKEISFNVPVISVGNLSMGGTGKTPHVEYLIKWLSAYLEVVALSRGYKRKTKGFLPVLAKSTVDEVGDEPLQYKIKFPDSGIYVDENRELGIPKILAQQPNAQLVVLDDAFQHRSVKPGLNILLTDRSNLFTEDYLLPMGRLREWRSAYKRADIIVVTKCGFDFSTSEMRKVIDRIKPTSKQNVYFTRYEYKNLYHLLYPEIEVRLQPNMHALIVSAIANAEYLLGYVDSIVSSVRALEYEDHHDFTSHEIAQLKAQFDLIDEENKVIITTEKDAMRMQKHTDFLRENQMPVFVLPAYVSFVQDEQSFQQRVKSFLLEFKS